MLAANAARVRTFSFQKKSTNKNLEAQYTEVKCEVFDSNVTKYFECNLHNDTNSSTALLDYNVMFKQELWNLTIDFTFFMERGGISNKLIDVKNLIACNLISKQDDHWLMKLLLDEIHRTANLPLTCPIKKVFIRIITYFFSV